MLRRLWAQAQLYLRELATETTVIVCASSALLIISHYQASTGNFRNVFGTVYDKHPAISALGHFYWFGSSFILYFVIPLLIAVATKGSRPVTFEASAAQAMVLAVAEESGCLFDGLCCSLPSPWSD